MENVNVNLISLPKEKLIEIIKCLKDHILSEMTVNGIKIK